MRARAFIDATEEVALWRLAGTTCPTRPRSVGAWCFLQPCSGRPTEIAVPPVPGVGTPRLLPSVWPGEVAVAFEAEVPAEGWGAPNALGIALRRAIPTVARVSAPRCRRLPTLLTHTGREPLPLTGPARPEPQHRSATCLVPASGWLPRETERWPATSARWHQGAAAGALVGRPPRCRCPASTRIIAGADRGPGVRRFGGGGGTGGAWPASPLAGARHPPGAATSWAASVPAAASTGIPWFTGGLQDEVDGRTRSWPSFWRPAAPYGFHPDAKQIASRSWPRRPA